MAEPHTAELTDLALRHGAVAAGVCAAGPFEEELATLTRHKASGRSGPLHFTYDDPEVASNLTMTHPWASSVVVMAASYAGDSPPPAERGPLVARFASMDHYRSLLPALEAVSRRLGEAGHRTEVVCDQSSHLDRAAAVRAGVGWRGRNTMVLTPYWGPWTLLGAVVTDASLETTPPSRRSCGSCVACLPACPTGALDEDGLDARRCLATWLQTPGPIPHWIRPKLGRRVYGCDDCLVVCPPGRRALDDNPIPSAEHDFEELLELEDDQLLERFSWWYVPHREPRFIRRNLLIAAGNSGERSVVGVIEAHLRHPSALIRGHAAWALASAGGHDSIPTLEASLATESDESVRIELLVALQMVEHPGMHESFLRHDEMSMGDAYPADMGSRQEPVTAAVRAMRAAGIEYEPFLYDYDRHPGALGAAEAIGVDPHLTVKTIVFETSRGDGLLALMNGDREVSTKTVARLVGVKRVEPASARDGRRWTGYEYGGTSPFGTRTAMPLFCQQDIATLERIYLNAGKRGFVVGIDPADLINALNPQQADLAAG